LFRCLTRGRLPLDAAVVTILPSAILTRGRSSRGGRTTRGTERATVPGIGIDVERGVRQVLDEAVRVRG